MGAVILIASGKGGAGKSTASALLGEALAFNRKRVLLLELDSGLRTLDGSLGITDRVVFDMGDVARGSADLRDALYPCGFCPGLSLLAAAAKPMELPEGFLARVTGELAPEFDFIFLDCPAGIGPELAEAARCSQLALMIATPDPASIRAARAAADLAASPGCPGRLLINRVPPKPKLLFPLADLDEVIDGVSLQLIGALWDDPGTRRAVMTGAPLPPDSKNAVPFSNIARRLCGEHTPLSIR